VVRWSECRQYATLSALTFAERLGAALLSHSDAYLTAWVVSPDQATVYALTGRAYDPARMAAERVAPAFLSGLANLAGEGRQERLYEISRRLFDSLAFVISVGAAAVVALNFAFVPLWVGPRFFGGQALTVVLACFVVTNVILSSLAEIVFAAGGIGRIEVMRTVEGLVRVCAQFVMLKWVGVIGIPIGGCIGMLLVSAWFLPLVAADLLRRKRSLIYLQLVQVGLRAAALLAVGGALGWLLRRGISTWNSPLFIGISAIVFFVLCLTGFAMSPGLRAEVSLLRVWLRGRILG
jgi:O-antigen/teichoic acid export membrane protein